MRTEGKGKGCYLVRLMVLTLKMELSYLSSPRAVLLSPTTQAVGDRGLGLRGGLGKLLKKTAMAIVDEMVWEV